MQEQIWNTASSKAAGVVQESLAGPVEVKGVKFIFRSLSSALGLHFSPYERILSHY